MQRQFEALLAEMDRRGRSATTVAARD
jgi:hypothetical protein